MSKIIRIIIYKAVILPVVLYRCETCSLTLKEEHRLTGNEYVGQAQVMTLYGTKNWTK
jgi:hypothetical protein